MPAPATERRGQNEFQLSLFGFDPAFDFDEIVHDARGRRLFPAAPEQSLLLLKATAREALKRGQAGAASGSATGLSRPIETTCCADSAGVRPM
jgi:hypothetical protein